MSLGKRAYSLLIFLGVAILGGGLLAGFVVPTVGVLTSTGRDVAAAMSSLPESLPEVDQPERTKVLMADGSLLTYFYDQNRLYTPLDKISPIMRQAQVAIEDHRFYEHGPIDPTGTLRAMVSTSQGVTQGGSSITQQYVRLALIEKARAENDETKREAAKANTLSRKINELRMAAGLEQEHSKDWILEHYLNISYYGDGAYGVEAAARHYFGVPAKDLNLAQSAMLAGLVRNPVTTNPVEYPQIAIERRNNVLDRMMELHLITDDEGKAAKAEPFDQSKVTEQKLDCANSRFQYICDYAKRILLGKGSPLEGASERERKADLYRGGYTIKLTIDPKTQKQAERTISNYLDPRDEAISVITMLEPPTGRIVSMAQSRTKMGDNIEHGKKKWAGETYYNYAVTHDMGGADGFQGGSTFKVFVAAAALANGMGAYGKFNAKSVMNLTGPFKSCEGSFSYPKSHPWRVVGGAGFIDMFAGVRRSVNTYFAQLIGAVGGCESVKMATKVGLKIGQPKPPEHPDVMSYDAIPSVTLGAIEVSPLSLVEAYATFANRGVHCDPIIIDSIKTREGVAIDPPSANCKRVVSKDVADAINKIFQGPYHGGTAAAAQVPGVQMAGKTGTVSDNAAVWTVGYTPQLAGAAVLSYDKDPRFAKYWKPKKSYLRGAYMTYSKHRLQGLSGPEVGARLLKPSFAYAIKNYDQKVRFKEPPASVLNGQWVGVPSCAGASVSACKSRLADAGFTYFTTDVDSDAEKGAVVDTTPSGKAPKQSSVSINISKGPKKGSAGWCQLDGHAADPSCATQPQPGACLPGYTYIPDPSPGMCIPTQGQGNGRNGG